MMRYVSANPLQDGLRLEPTPGPTTLVIFGASGDLTRRKLLPAIYRLSRGQRLPARDSAVRVRDRDRAARRGGAVEGNLRGTLAPHHRRKAVWNRSRDRAGAEPDRPRALRGGAGLPHRSLPR